MEQAKIEIKVAQTETAKTDNSDNGDNRKPVKMIRPGALIVGASSGIGAALARTLVAQGYTVALVARRLNLLETLAAELNAAANVTSDAQDDAQSAPVARAYAHDVRDYDAAPALFARIVADFGEQSALWLVVYNAGVMGAEEGNSGSWPFAEERTTIETNVIGAIRWLDLAAEALTQAGGGVIAGISSVAGDRGRRGNSAYQASKAALSTYLESLRYRLRRKGIFVVTVKPGYVATDLTAEMRLPRFVVISAKSAAEHIVRACQRGDRVVYVPGYWALIMGVIRMLPTALIARLPL